MPFSNRFIGPLMVSAVAAILSGCAVFPAVNPKVVNVGAPWDSDSAKQLMRPGAITVHGNAFLRQVGGGVVTCAGAEVTLLPDTPYATERLLHIYATTTRGYMPFNQMVAIRFVPDPADYHVAKRTTRCDSQGNFVFEGLLPGSYFVTLCVGWMSGGVRQGGCLLERTLLSPDRQTSLVMTS